MKTLNLALVTLLTLTSLNSSAFLSSTSNITQVNKDSEEIYFTVNRPDSEICSLQLVSNNPQGGPFDTLEIANLNEEIIITSKNVNSGEAVKVQFYETEDEAVFLDTGKVFGYANTYRMKSLSGYKLSTVFKNTFKSSDADFYGLIPVPCKKAN